MFYAQYTMDLQIWTGLTPKTTTTSGETRENSGESRDEMYE